MAKTATVTLDDDKETAVDPLEGIDAITVEEANQAFAITDELRGTAGITLQFTRVWPNTPGMVGHCGEMASEEYSLAEAARRYGPGRYVVRLRGPDNRYMKGGGKLNIAGNPQASAPSQTAQSGGDMLQLLEAMNRRQDEQQRAAEARREKMWALALAAMPVMPAIIAALKGGSGDSTAALITALKPAPAPSLAEVVTTLQGLKELSGADNKADPIDQLSKLLTVAKDLSGGGESGGAGSNWVDLVRDGLKAAPDLLGAFNSRQPQTVQAHVAPVQPVPTVQAAQPQPQIPQPETPAPGATVESQDMLVLIQPILRECAAKIESWAKRDRDPVMYAEVLLDDLPEWLVERVTPAQALELLNNAQWWEHLTRFAPALAAHRDWISEMRDELIVIFTAQLTPPESKTE